MGSAAVIVSQVQGQAWVRDAEGNLRALQVGMQIPADAVVVTEAGGQVVVTGDEGMALQIPQGQTVTLGAELFDEMDMAEAAIAAPSAEDVSALVAVLLAHQPDADVLEGLDPTEAVLSGEAGAAGGSYVTLANVMEHTTPLSMQFGQGSMSQLGDNARLGGSVAVNMGGGGSAGDSNPPVSKYPIIDISQRADPDKTDAHYSWVEGEGGSAQGDAWITAPDGLAKVTFNGVEVPLDFTDPSLPIYLELEHATVIIFGVQEGQDGMYLMNWGFIDDNQPRDHSNGRVVDEYVIEVTDKAGNTNSEILKVEVLEAEPESHQDLAATGMEAVAWEEGDERSDSDDDASQPSSAHVLSADTVWLGDGGALDFTGSALSAQFQRVDALDLTREGAAHSIQALGVDDVLSMSAGKNILTILADGDDSIDFDTKDVWSLNTEKSANGDFDVYEGRSQAGELVEVRISKGFDMISGLAAPETVQAAVSRTAPSQPEHDMEMQQMLAQQMVDQGKNGVDPF